MVNVERLISSSDQNVSTIASLLVDAVLLRRRSLSSDLGSAHVVERAYRDSGLAKLEHLLSGLNQHSQLGENDVDAAIEAVDRFWTTVLGPHVNYEANSSSREKDWVKVEDEHQLRVIVQGIDQSWDSDPKTILDWRRDQFLMLLSSHLIIALQNLEMYDEDADSRKELFNLLSSQPVLELLQIAHQLATQSATVALKREDLVRLVQVTRQMRRAMVAIDDRAAQ
jgi:hypothetical protein